MRKRQERGHSAPCEPPKILAYKGGWRWNLSGTWNSLPMRSRHDPASSPLPSQPRPWLGLPMALSARCWNQPADGLAALLASAWARATRLGSAPPPSSSSTASQDLSGIPPRACAQERKGARRNGIGLASFPLPHWASPSWAWPVAWGHGRAGRKVPRVLSNPEASSAAWDPDSPGVSLFRCFPLGPVAAYRAVATVSFSVSGEKNATDSMGT